MDIMKDGKELFESIPTMTPKVSLKTDLVKEFSEVSKNPGLKFLREFPAEECLKEDDICVQKTGPIYVYEVVALAIKP